MEENQKSPHKSWKKILAKIEQQPDTTLNGLIDEFSIPVSEAALSNRLKKEGLAYKKRRSTQATNNETTLSKRETLGKKHKKKLVLTKLKFIDESSINITITSLYGWGERSKRVYAYVPDAILTFKGTLKGGF
ncbi:MAG: hypothetical protein FWH37_09350 [Candidatus Bathyarchaeota archaeon]|nr:hypothetical protein [Candidatus Termiticorpusculum sp.]